MKQTRFRRGAGGIALLVFGAAAIVSAQPGQDKGDRQQQERQKGQRKGQRDDQRPDQRDQRDERRDYPVQNRSAQESKNWQKQKGWARQGGSWQGNNRWNQTKAQQWQREHRTWSQRGGYGGYYIPQNRFMAQFGSRNSFRLNSRPRIVGGYPRFNYGGYQFMMVDPWPEQWADDWYATDDLYVDYDDGYYLHNRRNPGFSIAISVVL